jgi:hypothetical protein
MLGNAVHPISELRQVKNNADLQQTRTGSPLTYDEYLSLLYDNQLAAKKTKRQVFSHERYDKDYNETEEAFDIDAPVSLLLANATDRHNKKRIQRTTTGRHICKKITGIALITRKKK